MFDEYYGEDIYEPTLADEILTEASAKLMAAIKQDVAAHIKEIETRNEYLEADNKNLREKVSAVNQEKRELEERRKELERKAARMSIKDFLGQRAVIMYRADYNHVAGPKCDKCNDDRVRPYKTPLGSDATEQCPCSVRHRVYAPKEFAMSSMSRERRGDEVRVWFKRYEKEDTYSSSTFVKNENVYSGDSDFGSLNMYKTFFLEEAQCQRFCDWLNNQDAG